MKKLGFYFNVPDKNTGAVYKKYDEKTKTPVYEFEDEERAEEILNARTKVTGEPFAFEIVEEGWVVREEDDGNVHVRPTINREVIDTPVEEVISYKEEKKPKKRAKKSAK